MAWKLHNANPGMGSAANWEQLKARMVREHTVLISLIVVYVASGALGLWFSYDTPAASLIWPPTGIALGALLVLGYRMWPAIFVSAGILYTIAIGAQTAVLGLAAGATFEAALLAYMVNRYADGRHALQTPRNSLTFAGVAALGCATSGSTITAVILVFCGLAKAHQYTQIWMAHAIGSFVSVLLITPIIVHYSNGGRERWRQRQSIEAAIVLLVLGGLGVVAFFRIPVELHQFPIQQLCMPVLLWGAFRLGSRAASAALLMLAMLVTAATLHGSGPFAIAGDPFYSLTIVQFFLAVSAIITLSLAALAADYREAEQQLRELVVTDPLTGLPNYRRLLEVLAAEIERARADDRSFAVVFFDMDGLKRLNDELGHLIGSRAVCRMAETLRSACRATDTVARYGGDEFVAVLTDSDYEQARLAVRRTTDLLGRDTDYPRLSVSAGIAMYPRDGGTPTTLLSAADRALYIAKAERSTNRRVVDLREWTSVG